MIRIFSYLKLMQPLVAYRFSFFLVERISDHSVAAFGGGPVVISIYSLGWCETCSNDSYEYSTLPKAVCLTPTCISYMLFVIVLCGKYCPY